MKLRTGRQRCQCVTWAVLTAAVMVSAVTPILTLDTDLWYHLRHGRVIIETGEIPADTSFSFLRPVRPFVDYYWLFQVVCHVVYQGAGYTGLIAVRTLCIAAMLLAARRLLMGGSACPRGRPSDWVIAGALGIVALSILPRALGFRPHDFTYAFLAISLAALCQRRTPVWLPLLAVAWVNFHGVTYPVLWVVVGAFGADLVADLVTGRRSLAGATRRATVLGAMACAPLLTPHGVSLLASPFQFSADASRIISELRPPDPAAPLHWNLDLLSPGGPGLVSMLLWLLPWLIWRAHQRGGVRPSRWLLVAAGIYLFHGAIRFHIELVLLSLPLLADALRTLPGHGVAGDRRGQFRPVPVMVSAMSCVALVAMAVSSWRLPYPLGDRGQLPSGVVAFLNEQGEGGRVFHSANFGGYFLGTLDDRFQITMDLELPFAFAAQDYDHVTHAYQEATVLGSFLNTYRPEFIASDPSAEGFARRLQDVAPHYRPVFVDDVMALWASAASRPQLIAEWQLRALDVEKWLADPSYLPHDSARAVTELERLVAQAPQSRKARRLLVRIHLAASRYPEALRHATELVAIPGPFAIDFQLLGDARAVAGDVVAAVAAIERALDLLPGDDADEAMPLHRRLGYLKLRQGQLRDAYRHMCQVADLDRPLAPREDLQLLARLAFEVGEVEHAEQLIRVLEWRRPR